MPSSVINSDDGVISGTSGLKSSGGDDGVLVFQSKGTETARINTDSQIVAAAGTASLPALTTTGDVNTGIFFPAADTIAFAEGGAEAMRITSSGQVGIGTSSPGNKLDIITGSTSSSEVHIGEVDDEGMYLISTVDSQFGISGGAEFVSNSWTARATSSGSIRSENGYIVFTTDTGLTDGSTFTPSERMRIDSSGNLLIHKTTDSFATAGTAIRPTGALDLTRDSNASLFINRLTNDGKLVEFYQAGVEEGNISVSGSTVSYNGGHLSRWAQMLTKPDLLKGTVMSNLDEMNVYVDADDNDVQNEQLNKVKVSDVEGDANVAGVFVNWTYDEAHQVDEINMAMTGDMIIRIAQGVAVQRGDLLMSAGDGTAKPQGDDIVRSKTIAKVTSTHITCTYDDGSYCVPCVLMAC
jgi:hypothetical protein